MKKKGGKGGWKIGGELSRYSNSRQTNTACYWNRINRERRGRDPYLFRDKFSPAGRGKKKITNHPAAPAVDLCIFIRGKSRFPRVSLSLSFFSPFENDEIKIIGSWMGWRFPRNGNRNAERNRTLRYISSPRFNGASIKRPREFEARAARPLFYEHVDSCLYRISDSYRGGVRACPKKECLKTRRGKCILLSLVLNRSRSFPEI